MHLRNLDLIVAMCYVVATVAWALLPDRPLPVGVLLAVPLVFMLPGYTLTQVLLRKRPARSASSTGLMPGLKIGRPIGAVDLLVFSLGLSLVIDVVTGFLLNLLPAGLQWQSWTLSLGCVTEVLTLLAALVRRSQGPPAQEIGAAGRRVRLKDGALLAPALVVVILALWLSITRPPQPQPSYTQFWMLPASAGNGCAVQIGVHSFETAPVIYRLEMTSNGQELASWPSITLSTQQEWDRLVPISPVAASGIVVDAQLYRLDQPGTIYREVHVMLHGCG
jgi:uncharacterized membrane protein